VIECSEIRSENFNSNPVMVGSSCGYEVPLNANFRFNQTSLWWGEAIAYRALDRIRKGNPAIELTSLRGTRVQAESLMAYPGKR